MTTNELKSAHTKTLDCGSAVKVVKEALVDAGYKLAPRYYTRSLAKKYDQPRDVVHVMLGRNEATEADAVKDTLETIKYAENKLDDCPIKDGLVWIDAHGGYSNTYKNGFVCLEVILWKRKAK